MLHRLVFSVTAASIALLAVGATASAHIDPDPSTAQAGARLTVGFTVEHGCDGSPTLQLDMRLPDDVSDPVPEPLDGWDGSVDTLDGDTVVTFVGGPLADDVEQTFSVTMTLPPNPDTTIYFPFVQRCEVGEIRWIGIPAEPGDELDEPAPAMLLTGPVASPPTTEAATAPTQPAVTQPAVTEPVVTDASTTTEPPEQTTVAPSTSEPALISADVDEPDAATIGTIAFIASIAAVLGIGGFVLYRSRRARAGNASDRP